MRATAHEPGPGPELAVEERAAVATGVAPDARLAAAGESLQALTRADGIAIALDTGDGIRCHASVGNAPEVGTPVRLDGGLSAVCLRTAATLCCADTEHDERADAGSCRALNLRSAVIAPVLANGAAIGLIACFWGRPRAFDRDTVAAIEFLARALSPGERRRANADAPMPARPLVARVVVVAVIVLLLALAAVYGWRRVRAQRQRPPAPNVAVSAAPLSLSTLTEPVLVSRIEPDYPRSALARATDREIVLDVTVDRDGRVDQVKIVKGDPVLAIAAAGAVANWRYRATQDSSPAFRMSARITLRLP